MKKVLLILSLSIVSVFAYDVEKEGDRWYVYKGSDLIGTYTYMSYLGKYSYGCGDPKKGFYETKYANTRGTYTEYYSTKRESKNAIIKYCKRR